MAKCVSSGWLLLAGAPAAAAPKLEAAIEWRGECDDEAALRAEMQARGAELAAVRVAENATKLRVLVQQTRSGGLIADIALLTRGSSEERQVEARECVGLRRAVAWVLVVLAEERAAAERATSPSTAAFPAPSVSAPLEAPPDAPSAAPQRASETRVEAPRHAPSNPCSTPGRRWQLGSELVVGLALVDAVALGPALAAHYRPCSKALPGISLGASRLVSVGYELDGRSITLERTSAQAGAWVTFGLPALRIGLALEAGRIRATGTPSAQGPGGTSSAPWFSCAAPVRFSVPLLTPALAATVGVDAVYTPLGYSLRYASGAQLARPRHVELRAALGLSGNF
jgi:hypothetical protein